MCSPHKTVLPLIPTGSRLFRPRGSSWTIATIFVLMTTLPALVFAAPPSCSSVPVKDRQYPWELPAPVYFEVKKALEQGAKFTGEAALHWHRYYRCLGCHIQTQSLMGIELSFPKADVDRTHLNFLYNSIASSQHADGSLWSSHSEYPKTQTALGMWSLVAWPDKEASFPTTYKTAGYLHAQYVKSEDSTYNPDQATGWWNTEVAQTAMTVIGLTNVVRTAPTIDTQKFKSYRLLDSAGLGGNNKNAADMEVGPDGKIYVLKYNGQVNRIDPNTREVTTIVPSIGYNSTGLAVATDGTLYISGSYGRLIRVRTNGKQDYVGGYHGGNLGDVEMGPDGLLYLSDMTYNRILRIDPTTGTVKKDIRDNRWLSYPLGLAFDHQGDLYIANYAGEYGYSILKMTPDDTFTPFADGLAFPPLWLDFDSQGNLYVSTLAFNYEGGYTPPGIYRINHDGIVERILEVGTVLQGIVRANGKMWVANASTNRLNEINATQLDTSLLPAFQKDIERASNYFLGNYRDNSSDKVVHALRLTGLAEARTVITNTNLLSRIDTALRAEEEWLRQSQNTNGGWGRYTNQASDPLITAMVGISLFYTKPVRDDPTIHGTIRHLLNTQLTNGAWNNVNNGLTTDLAATSFVIAYMPLLLERLKGVVVVPADCKLYSVSDKKLNDTQFLVFNFSNSLQNMTLNQLGPQYKGYDIESLAIHPQTRFIYAVSGNTPATGKQKGYLYTIDAQTGDLVSVGSTGFDKVYSLAFDDAGNFWGWAAGKGLISIDPTNGHSTLVLPSDLKVEDLTLINGQGIVTVYDEKTDITNLWRFNATTNQLEPSCSDLAGKFEAIEALNDNLLLLGEHGANHLHALQLDTCNVIRNIVATDEFQDIEGLAFGGADSEVKARLVAIANQKFKIWQINVEKLRVATNDGNTPPVTVPDESVSGEPSGTTPNEPGSGEQSETTPDTTCQAASAKNGTGTDSNSLFLNKDFMNRLNQKLLDEGEEPVILKSVWLDRLTLIIDDNEQLFYGRPDDVVKPVTDAQTSIGFVPGTEDGKESPHIVFPTDDGKWCSQIMKPLPITKEQLRNFFAKEVLDHFPDVNMVFGDISKAREFVIHGDGRVSLTVGPLESRGRLDLNITAPDANLQIYKKDCDVEEEGKEKCLLLRRPLIRLIKDANGDKIPDMELIYKDNARQPIYVEKLNYAPN